MLFVDNYKNTNIIIIYIYNYLHLFKYIIIIITKKNIDVLRWRPHLGESLDKKIM